MPRFFESVPKTDGAPFLLTGDSAAHIAKSLRMRGGESVVLCDSGVDHICEITEVTRDGVLLQVVESSKNETEPTVGVTLFQGYPKGDKLELIVQKAVELGVAEIVPTVCQRSISRPDSKSAEKKNLRLQKIAREACGQSQRGKVVEVAPQTTFEKSLDRLGDFDLVLLCYEGGGVPISSLPVKSAKKIAVLIGPEGGFAPEEVEAARGRGAHIITLGGRILRTETAPLAVLSVLMYESGNLG